LGSAIAFSHSCGSGRIESVSGVPAGCRRQWPGLVELTRYFVGQTMAFDLQVFLKAQEVPYCRLQDDAGDAPRLGRLGWLKTGESQSDAGEFVSTWVS
jgi:predicted component of type VI protein secretion system